LQSLYQQGLVIVKNKGAIAIILTIGPNYKGNYSLLANDSYVPNKTLDTHKLK